MVFISKAIESFFFIVMPAGRPLAVLLSMPVTQCGKAILICRITANAGAGLLFLTIFVLFFLDTYMWWIVWSTILGVIRALFLGLSVLTPWRNIFSRLPERYIYIGRSREKNEKYLSSRELGPLGLRTNCLIHLGFMQSFSVQITWRVCNDRKIFALRFGMPLWYRLHKR